jgi:hypothetical protein
LGTSIGGLDIPLIKIGNSNSVHKASFDS